MVYHCQARYGCQSASTYLKVITDTNFQGLIGSLEVVLVKLNL